jgi:cytochrome P450
MQGTVMLVNVWSFHNDTDFWGDPQNFRPERFLDEKGELLRNNYTLPFGTGECFHPRFLIPFLFASCSNTLSKS